MAGQVGEPAPDFSLMDGARNRVSLSDFHGKKNVVLAFYVLAFTGGWSRELQAFQNAIQEFAEADTQVLGISIDPWPSAGAFAKSLGLTFPLLSDWPQYEVCQAYDAWRPDRRVAQRVTMVIDKEGIICGRIADEPDMEAHARESLALVNQIAGKS